ncbi:hypothetical protein CGT72_16335 [Vibrio cholerae]|uniref:hypothetical protein n=1 Tax=Vibrio cholerae TaxID=666 RepID=UPI000BA9471C|nr:hypothetical protein [Vibrio cholerae]EHE6947957.1 hypothetical protein [Vibrio cholerae]PAS28820.1 hypothetical protein CGT72_16335 [Vibrio cholerae]
MVPNIRLIPKISKLPSGGFFIFEYCQWYGFLYLDRELRYHRKSQCYDNAKPKRILQEIESLNLEMSQMQSQMLQTVEAMIEQM